MVLSLYLFDEFFSGSYLKLSKKFKIFGSNDMNLKIYIVGAIYQNNSLRLYDILVSKFL